MAAPASHRRIKLTPSFQRDWAPNVHDAFRVVVTASDGHLMPDAVFAYREVPLQPGAATAVAVFDHVCSPVDLEEYPVGAPRVNADPPWFRLATVDVVERTRARCLETYHAVLGDVAALVFGMDAADVLVAQPAVWFGYTRAEDEADHSSVGSEGSLN